MEILSFAFGMLAMIAIILVAIVVIGIVKVYKQQNRINDLEQRIDHVNSDVFRSMDNRFEYAQRSRDELSREIDIRFEDIHRQLDSKIEHVDSEMGSRFDDTNSYIDSRFDKLIQKLNVTPIKKDLLKD
jgi:hypothetical protein